MTYTKTRRLAAYKSTYHETLLITLPLDSQHRTKVILLGANIVLTNTTIPLLIHI